MEEGFDQALGLPGEARDYLNPQTFGQRQEAPVEAPAQQHPYIGGSEALEAPRPSIFEDGDFSDAANPVPVQIGDQEPIRRAESGGHILAVKRYGQHRPVLPEGDLVQTPCHSEKDVQIQIVIGTLRIGFRFTETERFKRAAKLFSMVQNVSCLR